MRRSLLAAIVMHTHAVDNSVWYAVEKRGGKARFVGDYYRKTDITGIDAYQMSDKVLELMEWCANNGITLTTNKIATRQK